MPAKHKYKCLNDGELFIAWNKPTPECPECGCVKVEDWGEDPYEPLGMLRSHPASFGKPGAGKRIDGTLRGLADSYGLTNIDNRDGRGTKAVRPTEEKGKYGNMNIAGVNVPIGDRPCTVSGSSPYAAFKVPASQGKLPGNRAIPTQVVAAHKGTA